MQADGKEVPPQPVVSIALTAPMAVRNLADQAVWRSVSVTGVPASPLPAARSGMRITRQFMTLDGQPLDLDHLKQNTVFVLLLEGKAEDGQPHRALVQHGLPAGWELAGRLGSGDVPGMAWLGKLSETEAQPAADDRYAAVVALSAEHPDFRLAVRVRAVTPGTYELPGADVADMYRPGCSRGRRRGGLLSSVPNSAPFPTLPRCAGEGARNCSLSRAAGEGWGGGASALPAPSLLWLLAAIGAPLDYTFPPDLTRLAAAGTEVLDRNGRPLALFPAPAASGASAPRANRLC